MDIQLKVDTTAALIDKISDIPEKRKDPALASEFLKLSEDPSLPKVFRDFCENAFVSISGHADGPLNSTPKKRMLEIFMKLRVESRVFRV